jgi:hypothetical protein
MHFVAAGLFFLGRFAFAAGRFLFAFRAWLQQ